MANRAYDELCHLAGPVSRETFGKLEAFEAEFRRWAKAINLVAPSTLDEVWRRHILDSAQLAGLEPKALRWLDLGSGGGFPGAVMAILLSDRPDASIDLVESNGKKAAFLSTTLNKLGASARVHRCRIEAAPVSAETPEIVTARALAPLPLLLELSSRWLEAGAVGLFHKGRDYRAEVEESHNTWRFDLLEHASAIEPGSVILRIEGLHKAVSAGG